MIAPLTHAILGLGSNLGDRLATIEHAIDRIAALAKVTLLARARIYETEPLGPSDGLFLNTAVRIDTTLGPLELLDALLAIEKDLGRERRVRWGARTIDLDILWMEGPPVDEPRLTVPHPELEHRAFALAPLCDVLPEASWAKARLRALGGEPKLFSSSYL